MRKTVFTGTIIVCIALFAALSISTRHVGISTLNELRTQSLQVRIATGQVTYKAMDEFNIELITKNIADTTVVRPSAFTLLITNAKGELVGGRLINFLYASSSSKLHPQETCIDKLPMIIDPQQMPPDSYTITVKLSDYAITVTTVIKVEGQTMSRTFEAVILGVFLSFLIFQGVRAEQQGYANMWLGSGDAIHNNINPGERVSYYINNDGCNDIGDLSEYWAIEQSFQEWTHDPASFVDFNYAGNTWDDPTLCIGGGRDMRNVVGWMDRGPTGWLAVTVGVFDGNLRLLEVDTLFNDNHTWSTSDIGEDDAYDIQSVATHEAGHWLALEDLYSSINSEQTMFGIADYGELKKRTLNWGDKAGVRFLYPETYKPDSGLGWYTQGGDTALANINGVNGPDIVAAWVDAPGGENSIKYSIGWDMSSSSGKASSWSSTNTMPGWVGTETQGLGLSITNLDASPSYDMILAWVDNPGGENTIYYKIGWNLNSNGDPSSWSNLKTVPIGTVGSNTQGVATGFAYIDDDNVKDMMIVWVCAEDDEMYYKIGWDINTSGDASTWGNKRSKPGWMGTETSGVGVAISDIGQDNRPDVVFFWIDNPFGANHGYYEVCWDINEAGEVFFISEKRKIPGDWQWIGDASAGCGVAVSQVGLTSREEIVFTWIDDPTFDNSFNYRVQWDVLPNTPFPVTSQPTGAVSVTVGIPETYETTVNDYEGDPVKCTFDWGDGTTTTTDWYQSGDTPSASHEWDHTGTYQITVMAQDANHAEGSWSETLEITATGAVLDIEVPIHGTTDPPPGTYAYATPRSVGVTAIPDDHYQLAYWLYDGDNIGSNNPCTVFVSEGNHVLQAIFELEQILYRIGAQPTTGGTTEPPPGDYYDSYGSYIEVTANPFEHYEFDCWWLDGNPVSEDLTYGFTLDDTHWLQANFDFIGTHDIAVTNVTSDKTIVGQTCPINVTVTVENQGDIAEQIQVTLCANSTIVETKLVTLSIGEIRTLTYVWVTTGFPYGNYTLSAEAQIMVYSDDDPMDNSMTDGSILVTIAGDVDGDHDVDIYDIVAMANAYGTIKGQPGYVPNYDLDNDGDIDIFDIITAQGNYGQSW